MLSRSTWLWLLTGLGLVALSQYLQWVGGIHSSIASYSEPLADLTVAGILGGTVTTGLVVRHWWQQVCRGQREPTPGPSRGGGLS